MTMSDAVLGADLMRRATESDCCGGPDRDLLTLLREDASIYAGRGAIEAERLRAFVMECVSRAGLAPEALPFIREELETATDPYAVAAAARAVRSLRLLPPDIEDLLHGAAHRIGVVDELVHLDSYPAPPAADGRSAVAEIQETLTVIESIGTQHAQPTLQTGAPKDALRRLRDVELEDQDGEVMPLGQLLLGQPSAVAFFYTRCMNPNKCSRTVTQLATLQGLLADANAFVAAITYDPAYDSRARLRRYGEDRGFRFGPRARLLRSTGSFEPIRQALQLNVGYGDVTVNRHAVELLVTDEAGDLVSFQARQSWNEREVADIVLQMARS
jgi:cytochrome oxidase Cu insertion factor (SCO1/SenC/PrrC family)